MRYQATDTIRWRDGLNPLLIARNIWNHRDLIRQMTVRDIKERYRRAYLGVLWSLAYPLLRLGVYCFIFLVIFRPRVRTMSREEFIVGLFLGIIIYRIFQGTLSVSPVLVTSSRSLVKNVRFPLEILPVVSLATSFLLFLGPLSILLVTVLSLLKTVHLTMLLLPVVLLPMAMLTLGLSWFFASLGVFVGDFVHGVRFVTQLLFFMTPIIWRIDLVPEAYRPYVMLNPLAVIIESARAVVVQGTMPVWSHLAAVTAVSAALMLLGYLWFIKTKKGFGDVL